MRMRGFPIGGALRLVVSIASVVSVACAGGPGPEEGGHLVVFNAGSLARPIRAALDSFARREGVTVDQESAGSLETARKLTELGKTPDLIALADADVFPRYLMPVQVDGYVEFARNRMVLAFTDRSRFAGEITADNWWRVVLRPGVEVGRSDPELDPNGYRTLLVWQLTERYAGERGLAARLAQASPARNVRPKEADLVGLLQAGEFDYIWSYESMAKGIGLRYVTLPDQVDLSSVDRAADYAKASVTVRGATSDARVTFTGAPIVYAFAVPRAAPHRALGIRFAEFLLSADGRAILRREGLDALDTPRAAGHPGDWLTVLLPVDSTARAP
jgi:molybdate/tungstate transport system substrate-binding protein